MGEVRSPLSAPRPIHPEDDASEFACGDDIKDEWIRRYALAKHLAGGSRVYVTTRGTHIAGFYALATASIRRADATPKARRNVPNLVPAILLCRIAVDQEEAGQDLGTWLLRDAVLRTLEAAEVVGVRILLAHAASERARAFYLDKGFAPSPTVPLQVMIVLQDVKGLYAN